MISDFATNNGFFAVYNRGTRAEGGMATTFPDRLVIEDNIYQSVGPQSFVIRRKRVESATGDLDLSLDYPKNSLLAAAAFAGNDPHRFAANSSVPNTAGRYAARRFTGARRNGQRSACVRDAGSDLSLTCLSLQGDVVEQSACNFEGRTGKA